MAQEKGILSINSENFLPIIKKWLYTDKDIFIRELVSNGCDAVTKLQKLSMMGEASYPEGETFAIHVTVNPKEKTIVVSDNGIGMTHDEIKKYINQIAFSGATDFLSQYESKSEEDRDIIGHFGLGFYSAFMVADQVEIDSLSYQPGAVAAHWKSEGGIDYEMSDGVRTERGTDIILHIGEDGKEFLDEPTIYAALRKYCAFMPVEIYFHYVEEAEETEKAEDETPKAEEQPAAEKTEGANGVSEEDQGQENKEEEGPVPINDIHPLWTHQPSSCTEEDYRKFYHTLFRDGSDPLFWIHLNMDYPFRLQGILFFPRIANEMDALEGEVKLYANQVYIADNIKEVIPEFLLLLKGVIDCPDLPLNVSRSALQNDGYAAKMSAYITKKVADKLNDIFQEDRAQYETFWNDISLFVKYGCMKEEKFYDKVKEILLFASTNGGYKTLDEYLQANQEKNKDQVYYVTDEKQQVQYIQMLKDQGMEAVILSSRIDLNFLSFLEYKHMGKITFTRVDADIAQGLKEDGAKDVAKEKEMANLFHQLLHQPELKVTLEKLKSTQLASVVLLSEHSRRLLALKEQYQNQPEILKLFGDAKPEYTLVLNESNPLVQKLMAFLDQGGDTEKTKLVCEQLYDLALLGQKQLDSEEMGKFIARSNQMMEWMLEK